MRRSVFILMSAILPNMPTDTRIPPHVRRFYQRLLAGCSVLSDAELHRFLQSELQMLLGSPDTEASTEVTQRLEMAVHDLSENMSVTDDRRFETAQFRPTVTGGTALERWYMPADRSSFNPIIDNRAYDSPLAETMVRFLADRQVGT